MIFPWQITQWQALFQAYQEKRLPHAVLLIGAAGIGKKQFARAFAETILCRELDKNGTPCGQCQPCGLTKAKTHPDLLIIEPEETGQMIKIDQIREVIHFASETPQQGGYKIIIVTPANAMNIAAANALLKTLEEPVPNTLLLLTSDQSTRLPATIISRCQKIIFQKPAPDAALSWLKTEGGLSESTADLSLLLNLAEGAPLKVKELLENGTLTLRDELYRGLINLSQKRADPLELAAKWHEKDTRLLLTLLLSWLRDAIVSALTNNKADIIHSDYRDSFSQLKFSRQAILLFLDEVQQAYARITGSLNLNKQLLLEELLIRWHCVVGA